MSQMNPTYVANSGRQSVSHGTDGKQYINIMGLPEDVQGHIAAFDLDNDGRIEVSELANLARKHHENTETGALFKKLTVALGFLMCVLILVSFGLSFAVYELTRDTIVEDHVLKTIDHEAVQTASADFKIDSDTLVTRNSTMPVRTADSRVAAPPEAITSKNPDYFFMELYHVHVTAPDGGSAMFKINSATRKMNGQTEMEASTVTLHSDLGKLFLTGNQLEFDQAAADVLHDIGFQTTDGDGEGTRKLLFLGAYTGATIGALIGGAACMLATGGICAVAYFGAVAGAVVQIEGK